MLSLISYNCNFQIALGNITAGLQFLISFFSVVFSFFLFTTFASLTWTSSVFILSQDIKKPNVFAQA